MKMVGFCDKCDGMMLPSKIYEENLLKCNLCGIIKKINEELVDSYTMTILVKIKDLHDL